ncbi:recombination regulator RecX [Staphylococcus kloosii]|jgi:regulatory protein|uniref:recombination regulator RecX n=1 Tax=Staphylococcus kloosii TaxID=29384 RepID=UPI00189E2D04|nr:recombination regulator RecX [Staphylococcus kloosii]MBF7030794.1 recombination regulator RecX [Staphylococcus kloosii]
MPKITKIEVQKKNKERFNLYLDEQFEMGIDIDTFVHFNLKKDQVLEPSDMEQIQTYEQYRQALNKTIQYISYRKRTEQEIVTYLQDNEFAEAVIADVINYCYKEKLIDHVDYAESLKNTMIQTTDKGPEVYKQKLYQLGIEQDIIESYTEKFKQQQPIEQIIKTAQKILRQKKGPIIKQQDKLKQSMLQKGYGFDVINEVMKSMDFSQSEVELNQLLQADLEKVYNKNRRKYDGRTVVMKTIEALMRKGYNYDKIKNKLEESGISDGTEEIE